MSHPKTTSQKPSPRVVQLRLREEIFPYGCIYPQNAIDVGDGDFDAGRRRAANVGKDARWAEGGHSYESKRSVCVRAIVPTLTGVNGSLRIGPKWFVLPKELLRSQCHQRIDPCCPPRRQPAREKRDYEHRCCRDSKCHRIDRRYVIQQACDKACDGHGARDPERNRAGRVQDPDAKSM